LWSFANVDGKIKSDEEAKKKQRKGLVGESDTHSFSNPPLFFWAGGV
jgi:hypothetical protein